MLEDTEHLLVERIFGNPVVMIQSRLCRPADIERRSDVRPRPVEYLLNLAPIVHLLEIEVFHRRTGNDHSIKFLISHQFEIAVKRLHVFDGRILRSMAFQLHETDLNLQR